MSDSRKNNQNDRNNGYPQNSHGMYNRSPYTGSENIPDNYGFGPWQPNMNYNFDQFNYYQQPQPYYQKQESPFITDHFPENEYAGVKMKSGGKKKIKLEYIQGKNKRSVTFSKRKKGIMKKAYELNVLTGTEILLLVASESGHVYTFATPKLKPIISKHEHIIQSCLNEVPVPEKVEKKYDCKSVDKNSEYYRKYEKYYSSDNDEN